MDAIVLILALLAVSVPFLIAGLMRWFWFWLFISGTLAVCELASKLVTGHTISQQFWAWKKSKAKGWQLWLIFAGMIVFWAYLLCHLFLG